MGGTTFECTAQGETVDEAFKAAVEQALYDHGHSGYSGTIAEKDSFTVIDLPGGGTPTLATAMDFANELIKQDDRICDKWGPAGAIRFGGDTEGWLFFGWASC